MAETEKPSDVRERIGRYDIQVFDDTIHAVRGKFKKLLRNDPALFGTENLTRIERVIGSGFAPGAIEVDKNIDIKSARGLMAGVDLTLLNRQASVVDVARIAERAVADGAATVCVYPEHVSIVRSITLGNPPPIAVVGFPYVQEPNKAATEAALGQVRASIRDGAKEIDIVLARNFKDGEPDYRAHFDYIRSVVVEAAKSLVPVKVILETAYLDDTQKVEASLLAKIAGARYVKTSTGFALDDLMRPEISKSQKGATPHDVALIRRTVGNSTLNEYNRAVPMGVKASGGIRNREQVIAMYQAGASRIGASGGLDVRSDLEIAQSQEGKPLRGQIKNSQGGQGDPTPY